MKFLPLHHLCLVFLSSSSLSAMKVTTQEGSSQLLESSTAQQDQEQPQARDLQGQLDTIIKLQEKATKAGAGGTGTPLEEPFSCIPASAEIIKEAQDVTLVGECMTSTQTCAGCCRYHTSFLVCDTVNAFPQLQCVCIGNTVGGDAGGDDRGDVGGGGGIDVGGGGVDPGTGNGCRRNKRRLRSTKKSSKNDADGDGDDRSDSIVDPNACIGEVISFNPVTPIAQDLDTCANGSNWQGRRPLKNCTAASDCVGVTENAGASTCCRKLFCWCGVYDVYDEECVA